MDTRPQSFSSTATPPATGASNAYRILVRRLGRLGRLLLVGLALTVLPQCSEEGPPENSRKGKLEWLIKKQFGDRLKKIEVMKMSSGKGYSVYAEFLAEEGFSDSGTFSNIVSDMRLAFATLFQSGVSIHPRAKFAAWLPAQDKYGNRGELCVYSAVLEAEDAKKIRWEVANQLDFTKIWNASFVDREFLMKAGALNP